MSRTATAPTHPLFGDEALSHVAARFRVLGDPTRLRILNTLMQGEHAVGELCEVTGLEQSNVSRHLSVLRREGMVARRSDGTRALYRIDDPTVEKLCEIVCGGLEGRHRQIVAGLPRRRRR
jgi:ArsR family transcriptional regulator